MDLEKIIELLSYTLPSIVTGGVAYFFFLNYTKSEEQKLKLEMLREHRKQALPIKLMAYERVILFLERIKPFVLVLNIMPDNDEKIDYAQKLIKNIDQELKHNLTQQIYMSEQCWSVVIAVKNETIQLVNKNCEDTTVKDANQLRKKLTEITLVNGAPSTKAQSFIKEEIDRIL